MNSPTPAAPPEDDHAVAEKIAREVGRETGEELCCAAKASLIQAIFSALATVRAEEAELTQAWREQAEAWEQRLIAAEAKLAEAREEIAAALERAKEYFRLLAENRAETTRLKADLHEANRIVDGYSSENAALVASCHALKASLDRLRTALEPFAEEANAFDPRPATKELGSVTYDDTARHQLWHKVIVGDLRRAREALSSLSEGAQSDPGEKK